jgi:7-carboxy-7-deazaguanine synthase
VDEVEDLLGKLDNVDRARVLLMPQGVNRDELRTKGEWLAAACQRHGFRFCPRLHIELWGNVRGR